ncbi:alpha/beta fold hydrolase [Lentzea alba]|uniref:thioesterase II family protein n=1 Tax=Lentzea alba TaxID=2714351 RepID=UPI0039BFE6B0
MARVVCLPHAGGAASFFGSWGDETSAEVLAVQYPGREDRLGDAFPADVTALAGEIAAALPTDLPIVLFGHSLGAIVAYEVARALEFRHGVGPAHLVVSGRRAPSDPPGGDVHRWSDDQLVDELVRLGGTDGGVLRVPEARSVFLPAIRADFRIAETYRHSPGPEPSCPLTAVIGTEDTEVDAEQARRWAGHTTGEFALHLLPGGHFYLIAERDALLDIIETKTGMRHRETVG